MQARRSLLLAMACLGVAACTRDRAPDAPTHRCIEIPNGLVECEAVADGDANAAAR